MTNYKQTLNLPVTNFSMRANLSESELRILNDWHENKLYDILRSKNRGKKKFFVHDGPPYANGRIHIGHAINKILKDIIIKLKGLMGYDVLYIPGWDCHGLPIELKVEELISKSNIQVCSKDFKLMCRNYACKQIEKQKKGFIRLGILGDWKRSYSTMNFIIEAYTLRNFGRMISRGYIYQGVKPVHWCVQCSSVLADAELEYYTDLSPSVFIKFLAVNSYDVAKKFGFDYFKDSIFLLAWTTMPWTLPGNRALAVHPDYDYSLIIIEKEYYIVATSVLENIICRLKCSHWKVLSCIKGKNLEHVLCYHPFMPFQVPVVLADYILLNMGTGIVHVAPGHGTDDYSVGLKYNLEIINLIDSSGYYISGIVNDLNNLQVFDANSVVIQLLDQKKSLLISEKIYHSYPYCWRHKIPVIFRTTAQWFINLNYNNFRENFLKKIEQIIWIPEKGKSNIRSMFMNRPDWCISRQRDWGVPITVFIHKKTGKLHPRTVEYIEEIASKIEKHGVQVWWDLDLVEMLGNDSIYYDKVYDVLDVWFDSGSTYFSVMSMYPEILNHVSDIYLEGSDQYRGWFMSSLILAIATDNYIPCKKILAHGFSVDSDGKKMSKSLNNVISPEQIINKFGADVLRLWVASSDYTKEMVLSDDSMQYASIVYRRIRNTARFILGNINDFNPNLHIVSSKDMIVLDRWAVSRALSTQLSIISDYENYNFHSVVQKIMYFCSIEMSSFYLDVIKDRQYVIKKDSIARRSSQTALYHIIEAMVRWIAPILSFTADEIWKYIPGERTSYIFCEEWYRGLFSMDCTEQMNDDYWNTFLTIRSEVNKVIEYERKNNKYFGSLLELNVILYAESELRSFLNKLGHELYFGFLTSSVTVSDYYSACEGSYQSNVLDGLKIFVSKASGNRCPRCWHYRSDIGQSCDHPDICGRCIQNVFGDGELRRFI